MGIEFFFKMSSLGIFKVILHWLQAALVPDHVNRIISFIFFYIYSILFWNNYEHTGSWKGSTEESHAFCPVSPNGYILHNYNTLPKPWIWHVRNVFIWSYAIWSRVYTCITTTTIKLQNYPITTMFFPVMVIYTHTHHLSLTISNLW